MFISRYKIVGHSMEPTLVEGKVVWLNHLAYIFFKPKVGDIVVFNFQGKDLIKRIVSVDKNIVRLAGDNKVDSLEVGSVKLNDIRGKVWQ